MNAQKTVKASEAFDFVILRARELLGAKCTVSAAVKELIGPITVFVCHKTANGSKKESEVFVSGAAGGYGVKVGDQVDYKNDMNMVRGSGSLDVQNIIELDLDGNIIKKTNDVGVNEKRAWYVLK